ncbi:ribosomal L7Ae/L30e/S12e/Gadd45 family protein [Clostridium sp. D2Q-11]|uniref:Ribosomal L7Ae/L30e/S12e/Gadd45 family protein n=1 Tax=Anaeromonas frigoriresistens TaxID=2683708 RepID=A0A942UYF0_9FIRM|nr:ribosomal L7Ae/L30e/S12e/Gadd45 family protein [Anaeromonas frigoriresistens]MBS4539890.1 ribosomal L7Ae/L30e/S12e/Gadd45 family protein [Anaeromonas frigoriresistens]
MNNFYSFLGIGQKASIIKAGEFKAEEAIKFKRSVLIILAEDASDNTKKKFTNLSEKNNIELLICGNKENLGNALGKNYISVIAVCDKKFSDTLKKRSKCIT